MCIRDRVRAVEHRRRGSAEACKESAAGEQIANDGFAARNQFVAEHIPRARLETPVVEQAGERGAAFRPNREVVLEDDRLSVEQEALAGAGRVLDQLIDQRDEPLSKALDRMVPLAVPMGCLLYTSPSPRDRQKSRMP